MKNGKLYNLAMVFICVIMLIGCQEDKREVKSMEKSVLSPQPSRILPTQSLQSVDFKNEQEIFKIIEESYLKANSNNNGELELFLTKEYKDGKVVIARKHYGEGHSFIDLLYVDSRGKVLPLGHDYTPMSMCFSVKVARYNGDTFVFGIFNDEKWDDLKNEKVKVDIKKVTALFKNGKSFNESVTMDKGYIIFVNENTKLKDLKFFNDKGILQSSLVEYGDSVTND